jgi:hypothetical protein
MSAPQTKERPASMLRAMFASLGSLLGVKDKARAKPAAQAPAAETTAQETAAPAADAAAEPAAPAEPEAAETVVVETVAVEAAEVDPVQDEVVAVEVVTVEAVAVETETAAEPEVVVAEAVEVEPVETVIVETVAVQPETGSALPVANYDELSVASLRARLRNLSNDDLNQLMTYERAHQDRPEVIKMFQNRLTKMTSGLPKLEE